MLPPRRATAPASAPPVELASQAVAT
jgi:hypothetical protein